jgi:non-homologous end joining protein Ku
MSYTALAPQPSRPSTSFTLAFGVLNIPLSVYTGTEETRVNRSEFLDGDSSIPVGRAPIRKDTGEVVPAGAVVRMAEATSGAWVTLTDDEIADCTSPRGLAEVITFVPNKDVSQYLASNVAQVRPKAVKGKPDPAGERAFALLLTVLKKKKVVALISVALRGPAKHALLAADGSLTYIYTADQIREARDLADSFKFSAAETQLAEALVDAVGVSTPVITDDTAPLVRAYVEDKAKGAPAPAKVIVAEPAPDLIAALTASLDAAGKAKKSKVA